MDTIDAILCLGKQLDPLSGQEPTMRLERSADGRWHAHLWIGHYRLHVAGGAGDTHHDVLDAMHGDLVRRNKDFATRANEALKKFAAKFGRVLRLVTDDGPGKAS